jgi:peptidoglycan/LPS O-acetylase OafA/YrhL
VILAKGLEVVGVEFTVNAWTAALLVAALTIPAALAHHLVEEPSRRAIRNAWKRRLRRSAVRTVAAAT